MLKTFITGTDTDAGKTFLSASLLFTLHQKNPALTLIPRKPIASGCQKTSLNTLSCSDAAILQQASQSHEPLHTICPFQFEAAISPERAIRKSGKEIDISDLRQACQSDKGDFLLVEGAGGFYSPLAVDGTNADLAKSLGYGVILVVGNKLGCINHFLLTQNAIEQAGLKLIAVFVNDLTEDADIDNFNDIKIRTEAPCLHLSYQKNHQPVLIDGLEKIKPFRDLLIPL